MTCLPGADTEVVSAHVLRSLMSTKSDPVSVVVIVSGLNDLVSSETGEYVLRQTDLRAVTEGLRDSFQILVDKCWGIAPEVRVMICPMYAVDFTRANNIRRRHEHQTLCEVMVQCINIDIDNLQVQVQVQISLFQLQPGDASGPSYPITTSTIYSFLVFRID